MQANIKRLLSMLMVFVLVLGLIPSAAAATDDGTKTATEPTATKETTIPTEEMKSEEEWDPLEPTPEDLERWAELASQLPNTIEEDWPFDPDVKFPYGEPQENYYPGILLEPDPYGISLLADMSLIPEEMYDNSILRALEYTGYDVQWLKDNGFLYVAQYVSSNINSTRPEILSDIGYDDYSPFLNGDETVADSSTVSGKAPDIAKFESNGLVCASFVTYFICNYLPNIEGVDTTWIHDAVKATTATSTGYSTASVWAWSTGLDNLASTADSGVTKYTDEDTAYANLVPGDVIIFSRDGDLVHAAIYAGSYDMYNVSGTNRGEQHFIIHVGNSRGPEISTTGYMANAGSKGSTPSAWYHIEYPEDVQATGFIELYKKDPNGSALSGAKFKAVHQDTGDVYYIGPTNSSGYAISGELPLGKYVVTESVFPTGYEASGQSSWSVTLTEDTPGMTITINAVNQKITGKAKVIKQATNSGTVAGWPFLLKNSAGTSLGQYVTDSQGVITLNLEPGTYTIQELVPDFADEYWICDTTPQTFTVKAGETATVSFTNEWLGKAQVVKETTNSGRKDGWPFVLKDSSGNSLGRYVTDSQGVIALDLNPGTYIIQEELPEFADEYWVCDTTPRTFTVKAGQTATVTFTNEWLGKAQVLKQTTNNGRKDGWPFVLKDASGNALGRYVTDSQGIIGLNLSPGTYTIQEETPDFADEYWICDTAPQTVTIKAGETATVTFTNQWNGKAKIIKTVEPAGSGSVEGKTFTIHRILESGTAISAEYVTTVTTGADGTILTDLAPGKYLISEELSEDSLWECVSGQSQEVIVSAGQTAEVSFVNALKPGKIEVLKVNHEGSILAGAVFLLEWSSDGVSWQDVTYTDSQYPIVGGCTSEGLQDGKLTVGKSGTVQFTGLHPDLYYRLTEVKAPDGYQLLADYAYEGKLPVDQALTIQLKVVNVPVFKIPETGSKSIPLMIASLGICLAGLAGSLIYLRKRKK